MLFLVTSVNYADRSTISIAGSAIQKELGLSAVSMGYIFRPLLGLMLLGRFLEDGFWIAMVLKLSMLLASFLVTFHFASRVCWFC